MFGMVVSQGIKMLSKVISDSQENSMIIACAIGIGLGVTVVPELNMIPLRKRNNKLELNKNPH